MAEGTIPGGAALPATLALAGALLAPIIGVIANALSRTSIQRRQQEMEYWKTRLDLIEKALSAGQSLSNALNVQIDVSNIETEYRRVLLAIREPKPPAIDTPMPFEQRAFLLRMVMLPKPAALAGWIATSTFYIFSIYFVLYILVNILVEWPPHSLIPNLVVFIAIIFVARYGAIRSARAAIKHAREKFEREAAALRDIRIFHRS